MREISLGANLSKTYTNHCVRATAITLWSDSCIPARHIMSISGHVSEQSLASYNRRPSTSQLKNCSDILSTALQNDQAPVPNAITAQLSARPNFASTSTVSVMAPNASLGGIFNSCHIGEAQVFVFSNQWTCFRSVNLIQIDFLQQVRILIYASCKLHYFNLQLSNCQLFNQWNFIDCCK